MLRVLALLHTVTVLVGERADVVRPSYDRMASFLAACRNHALKVAEDLDNQVEARLREGQAKCPLEKRPPVARLA